MPSYQDSVVLDEITDLAKRVSEAYWVSSTKCWVVYIRISQSQLWTLGDT